MLEGFGAALLDPDAKVPDGVIRPDGHPAWRRFTVYRNNVVSSLIDALETGFPTVAKLVGTEFFAAMAGVFVRAHPPSNPLMFKYGAAFPDWIAGFRPASSLPYLPDVARLDLARREAFHAADAAPAAPTLLAEIAPEALDTARLRLLPSLRVVTSSFPILTIWRINHEGADLPLTQTAQSVLILRPEMTVTMWPLPTGADTFLMALSDGAPLAEAAEAAAMVHRDFDLSTTMQTLIPARAFAGVIDA
ncbi:hypothetical protein FHS89_001748 [Rubricella aquisinus]|uniref:Putative DNA-binding domain-containing protein n=1 Tax=Rubricella aquisinus TaxID=2028108 RepID=A0A840WKV5_9RHOB|nr:DNA-binding domain-containing protein [Rubricella aquisinus]MBB5515728.1 hypothetical protein [Rubricella aquisinus]